MFKKIITTSIAATLLLTSSISSVLASEPTPPTERSYGMIVSFAVQGGVDYVNILKDDEKIYKYQVSSKAEIDDVNRYDFVSFTSTKDGLLDSKVVKLIEGADDNPEKVKINFAEASNVEMITAARIDTIDGTKLTYKPSGKSEVTYTVNADPTIWSLSNLDKQDAVDKGDYVVLIDTKDKGTEIDYIVVVTDEDMVKEEKYDMKSFLDQQAKQVKALQSANRKVSMKVGEKIKATFNVVYNDGTVENVTDSVQLKSSKTDIVTIQNGQLVAQKAGKATITASYQGKKAIIQVTVN